jgi:hypothetical protein
VNLELESRMENSSELVGVTNPLSVDLLYKRDFI